MKFYLGTHIDSWLRQVEVPLFISHRILKKRKTLKPATCEWALDSGGFTELSMYGEWRTTPKEYVESVRRYRDEIGNMDWAAPQDAMCEPWILDNAKAWLGGTVHAHQEWTVNNYLTLRNMAPDLPFIPVLQGWELDDYHKHVEMYDRAGINLTKENTVGLGSVCRRQATKDICGLVSSMWGLGLQLHGFGVKTNGVAQYGQMLKSADSLAWSFGGRRIRPCPEGPNVSCANCKHHAMKWRDNVIKKMEPVNDIQ